LHGNGLKVKPAVEIHGGDDVSESGNDTPNGCDELLVRGLGAGLMVVVVPYTVQGGTGNSARDPRLVGGGGVSEALNMKK
jgi:hypothetical protein